MAKSKVVKLVLTGILLTLVLNPVLVHARDSSNAGVMTIALAELPRQGVETYHLIHQGGPFPHGKDGVVFGNRERMLPAHKRGYYREYTVSTPGARDRGTRRIVCGGRPQLPDTCYYTADHYASFRMIVP
jgi:ribonuclease T1